MMKKGISTCISIGLLFLILFVNIRLFAFDSSFYDSFYENEYLNLEQPGINVAEQMHHLLHYILGKEQSLDSSVFNEKEIKHMEDVKNLYQKSRKISIICFIFGIFFVLILKKQEPKKWKAYLSKQFIIVSFCLFIIILILGLWAFTNFSDFWYRIHFLFFSNTLWLLDPTTDFLIRICPEALFEKLLLKISLGFIMIWIFFIGLSFWYLLKKAPIGFDQKNK